MQTIDRVIKILDAGERSSVWVKPRTLEEQEYVITVLLLAGAVQENFAVRIPNHGTLLVCPLVGYKEDPYTLNSVAIPRFLMEFDYDF